MAAVQVDSMNRKLEVEDRARVENGDPGLLYRYKGNVPIPSLGLMNDNLSISEAGYKAEVVNIFMNKNSAEKTPSIQYKKVYRYENREKPKESTSSNCDSGQLEYQL